MENKLVGNVKISKKKMQKKWLMVNWNDLGFLTQCENSILLSLNLCLFIIEVKVRIKEGTE